MPSAEPSSLHGFSGNRIERRSEKRDDSAVAAAFADPEARLYLFQGDKAVLRTQSRRRSDSSPSPRPRRFRGRPRRAPCSSAGPRRARGSRRRFPTSAAVDEAAIRLIDLRSLAIEGIVSARPSRRHGAGAEPLPTGTSATAIAASAGSASVMKIRRLSARLPVLRRRAFPAHRPGGDHARDRRRPLPCSAGRPVSRRACIPASPASSSRARRSRTRSAARRRRSPGSGSAGSAIIRASPGRSRRR